MLPPTTIYLTGVRNGTTDELASYHDTDLPLGLLAQPLTRDYLRYQHLYPWAGIDNGCFTKVGQARFSLRSYLSMIDEGLERFGDYLLFATAPDVAFDWRGTLEKSLPVLPQIRRAGAPAALVLQDGATDANVPWDELDCVFVGGSTEWKVGREARSLCASANRRGKWVHMGRVNTESRMIVAQEFGAGSADGTFLLHATQLAVATEAVLWQMTRGPWGRAAGPDEVRAAKEAMAALHGPSEAVRARAADALRRLRAPEIALRLADARQRGAGNLYPSIAREAAESAARSLGWTPEKVMDQARHAGEEIAVGDVLDWLRALHRRTTPERRARDWSEYGALTAGHRDNPGPDKSFSRAPRGPFATAANAMKVGKKLPADRYVHRSLYGSLPPAVRAGVDRALELAGVRLENVDLLKLGTVDETVSLLRYPDFDTDPFPGLSESWSVNLTTGGVKHATYRQNEGTPILHRKETFLAPDDPRVPALRAVTEDLERRGLFRETNRIGRRGTWDQMLRDAGVRVVGTSVLPLAGNPRKPKAPDLREDVEPAAAMPPGVERVVFMPHPGSNWVFDIAAYSNRRASSRDFVGNITIDRIPRITPACLRDFEALEGEVGRPVERFRSHWSFVEPRWRGRGIGVALYATALREAAARYGAAIGRDDCGRAGVVSDDAERVWASRSLRKHIVRSGSVAFWKDAVAPSGPSLAVRSNGGAHAATPPRLDTLEETRSWVCGRYRRIKCGSFRCVYDLGDGRALKLARHEGEGTAHNLAEAKNFACLGEHAPAVFDWDRERGFWLVVERVRPIEEEEFLAILAGKHGLDSDLVQCSSIFNEYLLRALKRRHHPLLADEQRRFGANAWATSLVDRLRACDVSAEDLTAKNWGVAADGRLVILDAPDSLSESNW